MFKKLICKFRGCYPSGETGYDQPIQNHHCGRCGEPMYTTIKVDRKSLDDMIEGKLTLESYFEEKK